MPMHQLADAHVRRAMETKMVSVDEYLTHVWVCKCTATECVSPVPPKNAWISTGPVTAENEERCGSALFVEDDENMQSH
jgi:hypothetical protein